MDTLQKEERVLEKGDKIRVKTRCGHRFYGVEDALVIEYSPQVYDKEDTYKVDLS
jgi:hypothetical protein